MTRILHAEDTRSIRSLLVKAFQVQFGDKVAVLSAANGTVAYAAWKHALTYGNKDDRYRLVITDLEMPPGGSGTDLVEKIRGHEAEAGIQPVSIIMFSSASPSQEWLTSNNVTWVPKPHFNDLVQAVRDKLGDL